MGRRSRSENGLTPNQTSSNLSSSSLRPVSSEKLAAAAAATNEGVSWAPSPVSSTSGVTGTGGRGAHVLIERRPRGNSPNMSKKRMLSSLIFDSRRGGEHSSLRTASPASSSISNRSNRSHRIGNTKITTGGKMSGGGGPTEAESSTSHFSMNGGQDSLTMDDIQASFNPFPMYNFRWILIPEVTLTIGGLLFALYRLQSMVPNSDYPEIPLLPYKTLIALTLCVPVFALFRKGDAYFRAPFTDERGYRDHLAADDGITAATVLPILLSCACCWDAYRPISDYSKKKKMLMKGIGRVEEEIGLGGIRPLVDVWEAAGIHAVYSPSQFPLAKVKGLIKPSLAKSLISFFEATGGGGGGGGSGGGGESGVGIGTGMGLGIGIGEAAVATLNPFTPSTSALIATSLSSPLESARALLSARRDLVLLTALNSVILVLHLFLAGTLLRIERLPRSNTKRFFGFLILSAVISCFTYAGFEVFGTRLPAFSLSPLEAATSTFIQQTSFYVVSRLARRGFTLGELSTMTAAGNALCLEFWRLSRSRWLFKRGHPFVPPTFRSPTPIIAFQSVLIPGALLSGFLLSPLLVLSRHIAQKPSHRLKWPIERERNRRLLAVGVFAGLAGIIFFMLGGWTGWILGWSGVAAGGQSKLSTTPSTSAAANTVMRTRKLFGKWGASGLNRPWIWAIQLAVYGGDGVHVKKAGMSTWNRWKRLALVAHWAGSIVVAVGGWQTRLVRSRRIRMLNGATSVSTGVGSKPNGGSIGGGGNLGGGGSESIKSGKKEGSTIGAETAREEKKMHASLNMRRKFFHALAVTMFVPGIAIDPAFTSLAFSVAFALFTFSEYARYFALYPVGAPLHIFFSEFIDSKDSGPVILSHFYLLTGCAGGVWLEGKGINRYTGVLVLGIGDSLASIVGKLIGRIHWPGSSKTVEGTLAFIISVITSAWMLRLLGMTESFSLPRYTIATTLAALLEASSKQNDNLVIPIYMWSLVSLLNC